MNQQRKITDPQELERLRRINNPSNELVGPYTGRCANCHGKNLGEDNTNYWCNCCDTSSFR